MGECLGGYASVGGWVSVWMDECVGGWVRVWVDG